MKKLCAILILISLYTAIFAEKITFSAGSMSGQAGDSSATTTLTGAQAEELKDLMKSQLRALKKGKKKKKA